VIRTEKIAGERPSQIGVVRRLGIAPVKGMRLLCPNEIMITAHGGAGDRRFFLIDEESKMLGAEVAGLPALMADWKMDPETLDLHFPDGSTTSGPVSLAGNVQVSAWDGHAVAGRVVSGPWAGALSDYMGRPVQLVLSQDQGGGVDVQPITLVSVASVQRLADELETTSLDPDRFRATLLLDGISAHQEDEWYGRTVLVGDAALKITGPIPRCVATTFSPVTGRRDFKTLHAIGRYRTTIHAGPLGKAALPFGVYALVSRAGRVRVGDGFTIQ